MSTAIESNTKLFHKYAEAAYLPTTQLSSTLGRLGCDQRRSFATSIADGGIQGYVARSERDIIISFAGTASPSLEQFLRFVANWAVNLNVKQLQHPSVTFNGERFRISGSVHAGFVNTLSSNLMNTVGRAIHNVAPPRGARYWLTGHSLGGAMSNLIALPLAKRYPIAGVYTFGAPRVGDEEYADAYPHEHVRVESVADIIPTLPTTPAALEAVASLLHRITAALEGLSSYVLSQKAQDLLRAIFRQLNAWAGNLSYKQPYKHSGTLYFLDESGDHIHQSQIDGEEPDSFEEFFGGLVQYLAGTALVSSGRRWIERLVEAAEGLEQSNAEFLKKWRADHDLVSYGRLLQLSA